MTARIYPTDGPRDFEDSSHEDEIYYALRDRLSEDYIVIHSFKYRKKFNRGFVERESDFVVYHRELGILCIEAKAGRNIVFRDSEWFYNGGRTKFNHDPYDQAADAMYRMRERINSEKDGGLGIKECSILSAVWFPDMNRSQLRSLDLPPHALTDFTLTYEDALDPDRKIREIFGACSNGKWNSYRHDYRPASFTSLSEDEEKSILDKVLLPSFNIVEMPSVRFDRTERKFLQLLDSQARILDFLVDQRSAVINGAAVTGKTLLAIERANQLASEGEKSLFLCVNRLLKEDVAKRIREKGLSDYVDIMTVSGLAKAKTGSFYDYRGLSKWLNTCPDESNIRSRHIIIDEGQDFGMRAISDAGVLESLYLLNSMHEDGSFYVFYDERQLIQGVDLPDLIREADCKMTLYVNCRNTRSISDCSINGLNRKTKHRLRDEAVPGEPPRFIFETDPKKVEDQIDKMIQSAKQDGIKAEDMVVLTCSTIRNSKHKAKIRVNRSDDQMKVWGSSKVPVYTCREFKGLEADVVFLVDVDKAVWEQDSEYQAPPGLLFYTGASRAKFQLAIAVEMTEGEAADVADILAGADNRHRRRPYLKLENILKKSLAR